MISVEAKITDKEMFRPEWDSSQPFVVVEPLPNLTDHTLFESNFWFMLPTELNVFLRAFEYLQSQGLTFYKTRQDLFNDLMRLNFVGSSPLSDFKRLRYLIDKMQSRCQVDDNLLVEALSYFSTVAKLYFNKHFAEMTPMSNTAHVTKNPASRQKFAADQQRIALGMYYESVSQSYPFLTYLRQMLAISYTGGDVRSFYQAISGGYSQAALINLLTLNGHAVHIPNPENVNAIRQLDLNGVDLVVIKQGEVFCLQVKSSPHSYSFTRSVSPRSFRDARAYLTSTLDCDIDAFRFGMVNFCPHIPSVGSDERRGHVQEIENAILIPIGLHRDQY